MDVSKGKKSNSSLTAAVIGCGRIGANTSPDLRNILPKCWLPLNHAESLLSIDGISVIALCDVSHRAAVNAAKRYGVDKIYTEYTKLIDECTPDIISVATRTPGRLEIIEYAANNEVKGIHVEKPLCRNMSEGKAAAKALISNGVAFSYGALRRYMEVYRYAKMIVDSGELGDLVQIIVNSGQTSLLWNHVHSVDIIMYYAGDNHVDYVQSALIIEPGSVSKEQVDDDPVVEHALIKFSNGVSGVISRAGGYNVILSCAKGEIIIAADGSWLEINKYPINSTGPYFLSNSRLYLESSCSGRQKAIVELKDAILDGKETSINIDEVLITQQILFALVYSELNGGIKFNINDVDDRFTVTGRSGNLYA
ncbi:MAG: Inositol 2-dehydrogenase [Pelotomaculum sp. PtaB.Bin104]|nr:MAG: Inositol 2-dehydrogenase [Pelotomaculum sp. PtaB.Bin104]